MLRGAVDSEVITKVGDVFYISMTHWHLGNYVMANHVLAFEQDRQISWEPVVYSYENLNMNNPLVIPDCANGDGNWNH